LQVELSAQNVHLEWMLVSDRTVEAGSSTLGFFWWKTGSLYPPHVAKVRRNSIRAWTPRD